MNARVHFIEVMCSKIEKEFLKRQRKIGLWEVISQSMAAFASHTSLNAVLDQHKHFSPQAIYKQRSKFPQHCFSAIRRAFHSTFSENYHQTSRVFAVDGTKVLLPPHFTDFGFRKHCNSKNNPSATVSCVFDVERDLIHDIKVWKHHDERSAFMSQTCTLKPKDTVLFDRGYFSKSMLGHLTRNNIHFVFRVKKNIMSKVRLGKRVMMIDPRTLDRYPVRVFESGTFRFVCSPNIKTVKEAGNLYRKRWRVEQGFRTLKCQMEFEKVHARTEHAMIQDMEIKSLLHSLAFGRKEIITSGKGRNTKVLRRNTNALILKVFFLVALPHEAEAHRRGQKKGIKTQSREGVG